MLRLKGFNKVEVEGEIVYRIIDLYIKYNKKKLDIIIYYGKLLIFCMNKFNRFCSYRRIKVLSWSLLN